MEQPVTPELTDDQIEKLCLIGEKAARKFILSRVASKEIESLEISVQAEDTKPLKLEVDVAITLSPSMKGFNVQKLVDEAVREAFFSAEKHLKGLKCHLRE